MTTRRSLAGLLLGCASLLTAGQLLAAGQALAADKVTLRTNWLLYGSHSETFARRPSF